MSDLGGNSFSVSKRRAKPIQLGPWASAIVGNIDWTSLGYDPIGDMQIFAGATSHEALRQRRRGEVETEVAAMLDAIKEFDAFDVIELIRLRELPVVPVAALVDGHDGSGAAIDLVSLVCLSRPSRMPSGKDRQSTEPHHAVSDLHARATRLLRLATFMHTASSALAADDPLVEIFFSIIQKKVVSPNDFASTSQLAATLLAFIDRYNQTARPFNWRYTAADLARLLDRISAHEKPASLPGRLKNPRRTYGVTHLARPATAYALRACSHTLLVGSRPTSASGSQAAVDDDHRLLMAVRGHVGGTLLLSARGCRTRGCPCPWSS
jgi:hypothetical protein